MTADRAAPPTVQIALRISPELRDRIKIAAMTNNRSVNSELTAILEENYPPPKESNPLRVAFHLLYQLMDWVQEADDEAEEEERISRANDILRAQDAGVTMKFSDERDHRGRRAIFISSRNTEGMDLSEIRRLGPPDLDPTWTGGREFALREPTPVELHDLRHRLFESSDHATANKYISRLAEATAEDAPKAKLAAEIREWLRSTSDYFSPRPTTRPKS